MGGTIITCPSDDVAEQAYRHKLLKILNYDVEKAMACYDFVKGTKESPNCKNPQESIDELRDGIYIMRGNLTPIFFNGNSREEYKYSCDGIGLKFGDRSLVIDLKDDRSNILGNNPVRESLCLFFSDAVVDMGGENNTRLANCGELFANNRYIPSLGELYFILTHIDAVNAALMAINEKRLSIDSIYLSSTPFLNNSYWLLDFHNGASYNSTIDEIKLLNHLSVRPCRKFWYSTTQSL